jgi:hypothetical protein
MRRALKFNGQQFGVLWALRSGCDDHSSEYDRAADHVGMVGSGELTG